MAHSCPECDCACYCGGDIDDCALEDPAAEARCTCCHDWDEDGYDEWDWDEDAT